jgi:hypothetical protein
METKTENNNQKNDPCSWKWLAYLSLSAAIIMILGIENALENKISFVIFALLTFIPIIITRKPGIAGITRRNLKSSIVAGSGAGIFYGIFRGLLFQTARKYVHWAWAVAIASAIQAIARRTPHSLIMGSIGGVLMQKYDNILAPSFMHGFQFFTALAIVLYL